MKPLLTVSLLLSLAGCSGTPVAPASSTAPSSTPATPAATGKPITLSVKLDGADAPVDPVVDAGIDADGKGAHYTIGTKNAGTSYYFLITLQASKALSSADLKPTDLTVFILNVGGLANGRAPSWQGVFSAGLESIPAMTLTPNGDKLDLAGAIQTSPILGGGKGLVTFDAKGLPTR